MPSTPTKPASNIKRTTDSGSIT